MTNLLFWLTIIAAAVCATMKAFPREKLGDKLRRLPRSEG
jgi:hypothetical protein